MQLRFYPWFSWCAREDVNGPLICYTVLSPPTSPPSFLNKLTFIYCVYRIHLHVLMITLTLLWPLINQEWNTAMMFPLPWFIFCLIFKIVIPGRAWRQVFLLHNSILQVECSTNPITFTSSAMVLWGVLKFFGPTIPILMAAVIFSCTTMIKVHSW